MTDHPPSTQPQPPRPPAEAGRLHPRRVYVTGVSRSGKSTFARRVADALGCPLHELDALIWTDAGGRRLTPAQRDAAVSRIAAGERWVAEGIYLDWASKALDRASVIVWLDTQSRVVVWRILCGHARRSVRRVNFLSGWLTVIDFACSTVRFRKHTGPFLNSHGDRVVRVRDEREAQDFLDSLSRHGAQR